MENIKEDLKKIILDVMLPKTEPYKEEINNAIKNNTLDQDEIDAKKDIESFIEELNNILEAIEENKLSPEDTKSIYEKIVTMINEHKEE